MNKAIKSYLLLALLLGGGFFTVFTLSNFLEKNAAPLPENYTDEEATLQGAKLKGYVFGFEGLIADWYWMKSLQYIGDKILKSKVRISLDNLNSLNPRMLYPYLNNATDLDPHFIAVYEYGATVLPDINKDQAIALTQKGIANNPQSWRLYHYLGYIYWQLKDYEKAAQTYTEGAKISGAPEFMKSMSARMTSEGGKRSTARAIYQQMFDEAQDSTSKENAKFRLDELKTLDERDLADKVLKNFQDKNKRCTGNWRELFLYFKTLTNEEADNFKFDSNFSPVDPKGVPYIINTKTCQTEASKESPFSIG